ncbi:ATP-binding protein [Aliarcobacter butzleri]|uniref:ATP-binding protein n=1 Tax=Aliarcobacter butzleri TaxID=28197 RepID=UPI00344B5EE6
MITNWEDVYFLSHVNIKNIIGKELINDDNVAVMELVKNAYDAGAKTVTVEFKNLKKEQKEHELLIVDDGNGMSKDDILHKWLNLAYSIKRVQNAQNNRLQAGNKGIGRFSCDRLGKELNIYTKRDSEIYQLQINWEDFENITDYNIQINQIPMKLRKITADEAKKETDYDIGASGTIIKISNLRVQWVQLDGNSLFNEILNYQKFVSLKSTLEKLINKSQVESDDFKIFLKVDEIDDKNETSYNKQINGEIKNKFFEKLDFNTTYIQSAISDDGQYIITKLKDRDKMIFKTIERNNEFPELKNVKIILMHLNSYGKAYFKKQMGVRSVDFGSVYLFINGFRIPPYGEIDNDSFGIEMRKGQGQRRYLGGREIIGRIEIEDRDNQFKIISSREGIEENEAYKQLVHKSRKSKTNQFKNNGFFYKTLRRLEKYVVEGLKWDSVPKRYTETLIDLVINQNDWNENQEEYVLNREKKFNNISKNIFSFMGLDSKNIMDLDINREVLSYLIENDKLLTKSNISKFLRDLGQIPNYAIHEDLKFFIEGLIKRIDDEKLVKKFNFIVNSKLVDIDEILDKEQTYNQLDKRIKILESEQENLKQELLKSQKKNKTLKQELVEIEKVKTFFERLNTTDKQQVLDLHHSIGTATVTINNHLGQIQKKIRNGQIDKDFLEKKINQIAFVNNKISSIANFATKARWDADSEDIEDDIVRYIDNYITTVCMFELKTLDHQNLNIFISNNTNKEYIIKFQPIKIAMLFDNLISNSRKAYSSEINIKLFIKEYKLIIEYTDNGKGIDLTIQDKIFDLGFSTSLGGAGMGMGHIKKILEELNDSTIELDKTFINGAKFIIRIQNET